MLILKKRKSDLNLFLVLILFLLSFFCLVAVRDSHAADCGRSSEVQQFVKEENFEEARKLLEKQLGKGNMSPEEESELLMDIAGCQFNIGQYYQAEKLVERAIKLGCSKSNRYCPVEKLYNYAECLYFQRRYEEAVEKYKEALDLLKETEVPKLRRKLYMSLASCHVSLEQYKKAGTFQEEAVRLDREIFGDEDINYGWGLLKLSDIYRKLKNKRSKQLFAKAIYIFRLSNRDRILTEYGISKEPTTEGDRALKARLDSYLFGNKVETDYSQVDSFLFEKRPDISPLSKEGTNHCSLWKNQYQAEEAPGLVWVDLNKPLKGIIIAVHGLGLHHGAYESFGRHIAKEGIMTIAFDVRGFGTYLESKGSERLDMKGCVEDLKQIVETISHDYPDRSIFLLGESMGGAIVLRLGAMAPKSITGIICSVPSGSRYEPAFTKVRVGLNYLKDKHDRLDISPYVVRHATSSKRLRRAWKTDRNSRLRLSPKELLEFRNFMKKNVEYARSIDKLPVLIFQGDEDKLVKSKGTYDLFEAVASKDKTMVVVGGTEHLIFESGQYRNGITLGVVGWMNAHSLMERQKKSSEPEAEAGP